MLWLLIGGSLSIKYIRGINIFLDYSGLFISSDFSVKSTLVSGFSIKWANSVCSFACLLSWFNLEFYKDITIFTN